MVRCIMFGQGQTLVSYHIPVRCSVHCIHIFIKAVTTNMCITITMNCLTCQNLALTHDCLRYVVSARDSSYCYCQRHLVTIPFEVVSVSRSLGDHGVGSYCCCQRHMVSRSWTFGACVNVTWRRYCGHLWLVSASCHCSFQRQLEYLININTSILIARMYALIYTIHMAYSFLIVTYFICMP